MCYEVSVKSLNSGKKRHGKRGKGHGYCGNGHEISESEAGHVFLRLDETRVPLSRHV